MVTFKVSLPFVSEEDCNACIATMSSKFRDNVDFIDNSVPGKNCGVAASWNQTLDKVLAEQLDWLILLSTSIRFKESSSLDFIQALNQFNKYTVIEAMPVLGWHLIAFSKDCLAKVGKFDKNLPIYFGDIDYSLRIQKAYDIDLREGEQKLLWDKVEININDLGMGRAAKLIDVNDPAEPRIEYFKKKWNRHPGAWQEDSYEHPFNDPTKPLSWWPTPPSPLATNHEYWSVA